MTFIYKNQIDDKRRDTEKEGEREREREREKRLGTVHERSPVHDGTVYTRPF